MNTLIAYIQKMFTPTEQPNTYGAALEAYIVSKHPKDAADIEFYTREFDRKQAESFWGFGDRYGR